MLPPSIPIFPLPTTVLFPNVFLPLHIFEPRYRQMVNDALAGDRMIGMVLLKPGFEGDYDGKPPVYHTGCMGLITHVERLEDGRFNLILRGIEKFTIMGEEAPGIDQLYRRAMITPIDETPTAADRQALGAERKKLETLLTPVFEGTLAQHRLPDAMPDEDLVNSLAQYLDLEPLEKLALLERPGALARCRSLVELLEMKAIAKNMSGDAGMIH
jgi:Lon protease-like protein